MIKGILQSLHDCQLRRNPPVMEPLPFPPPDPGFRDPAIRAKRVRYGVAKVARLREGAAHSPAISSTVELPAETPLGTRALY